MPRPRNGRYDMDDAMKLPAIPLLAAAAITIAGCTASPDAADPVGTKIYNIVTLHGDRVNVRVTQETDKRHSYRTLIRRTSRTDLDAIDRQRILEEGTRAAMDQTCAEHTADQPIFAPDYHQESGSFICR
jgi:hypothetical protein